VPIDIVPNGIPRFEDIPLDLPAQTAAPDGFPVILFIGHLGYEPNVDAEQGPGALDVGLRRHLARGWVDGDDLLAVDEPDDPAGLRRRGHEGRGGKRAGQMMITYEWSDWRNAVFWWIQSVYIRPEFRRKGIYRRLYDFVKQRAKAQGGVCGFRLYVEKENAGAQKTYAALGMAESFAVGLGGRRRRCPLLFLQFNDLLLQIRDHFLHLFYGGLQLLQL
jgi:ribosomal protein S18 acetylase RimI-like enzyme